MSIKKNIVIAITLILLVILPAPQISLAYEDKTRIYGSDRVRTALEICDSAWISANTIVLAPSNQENLVDALAAAALAGQESAPILLTPKDSLDKDVKERMISLGVRKVMIIGAISDDVASEIDAIPGVEIVVLKGDNRLQTVKAINEKLLAPAGTFVVGYNALPDALSVASYAAKNSYAIILADAEGHLPSGQAPLGSNVYIIGGPTLVRDIPGATRVYGITRYETNMKIAQTLNYSYSEVFVANGNNDHLVDSLTAAPLAAKSGAFIALTDGESVGASTVINTKISPTSRIIALGGNNIVSDLIRNMVKHVYTSFNVKSARAIESSLLEIKFSKPVDKYSILIEPGFNKLKHGVIAIERNPQDDGQKDIDTDYMPADLSPDGTTLTLAVKEGSYLDGSYTLAINPGIITSEEYGEELGTYTTTFSVDDSIPPSVGSVRYNPATDQIEVEMSEVCEILPTVIVNGEGSEVLTEDYLRTMLSFNNVGDRNEELLIKVFKAKDYAGNVQQGSYLQTIKIPMDETLLKVDKITQIGSNKFKITFNKAIDPCDNDNLRAANVEEGIVVLRGGAPISVENVEIDPDDPGKRSYTVILDNEGAPDYSFYGDKTAVEMKIYFEAKVLRDVFGNSNQDIEETFHMAKDSIGPKIISVRQNWAGDAFILRFDEDIQTVALADLLKIRWGGIYVTDNYNSMPFELLNPREMKITHRTGGSPISSGIYEFILDNDAIPDKHWNYNTAQSVQIVVK